MAQQENAGDRKGQLDLIRVGCFSVWPLAYSGQVPVFRVKPKRLTLWNERRDLLVCALLIFSSGIRVDLKWPWFLKRSVKGVFPLREQPGKPLVGRRARGSTAGLGQPLDGTNGAIEGALGTVNELRIILWIDQSANP